MKCNKVQVVVCYQNQSDSFILLLRTNKKRGHFWQNVTGSVEKNEDITSAAARELEEETQLRSIKTIDLNKQFEFQDQWERNVTEHCFLCLTDSQEVVLSDEHDKYQWKVLNSIKQADYKFISNFEALKLAQAYLGNLP